jgi:hypothetical protein
MRIILISLSAFGKEKQGFVICENMAISVRMVPALGENQGRLRKLQKFFLRYLQLDMSELNFVY